MKVLAILYNGFKAAQQEPRLLGTVENKLGIAKWLSSQGHELIGACNYLLYKTYLHLLQWVCRVNCDGYQSQQTLGVE